MSDQHQQCGSRALNTQIMEAEIYMILAVVVGGAESANCTSLLEITPTTNFSNVNISCFGRDNDQASQKSLSFSARGMMVAMP